MTKQKNSNSLWVVKVGSALLTNNGFGLDYQLIKEWVKQIVELRESGMQIILVSSGAVAEGVKRLGLKKRPKAINELQAAASVGQMGLVEAYESAFKAYQVMTAQVLLTRDDLANRKRYLNARSTLKTLLDYRVIPIINENDAVVTDEIRFGDNDTLGALVANLVEAEKLIILTDQEGLFNKDPRFNADAVLVSTAKATDKTLLAMAGAGQTALGRGGMLTKLIAAKAAARSGASTVIAYGRKNNVLSLLAKGESIGTLLTPDDNPVAARKRWLAGQLEPKGALIVDDGAVQVLLNQGKSLLAVGVKEVKGVFSRGELVSCFDLQGNEIARGLINYSKDETLLIRGKASSEFENLLGYQGEPELIHRDNLVLV